MKTWHKEMIVVAVVLTGTTFFLANNLINWITLVAVLLTFNHCQIADRMQEKQRAMTKPTVHCHWLLDKVFIGKEIVWIIVFIMTHNYAAVGGAVMFTLYPLWRSYYRKKIRPLDDPLTGAQVMNVVLDIDSDEEVEFLKYIDENFK